ncbi:MAG: hypothetical protein HC902_00720 [Calothrix sp. SM1_5_4]|nr:hypothetical protein [Calothrix sp. SM1_5_4]
MRHLGLLIIIIGISCGTLSYAEDEDQQEKANQKGLVYVESDYMTTAGSGDFRLIPYAERRREWGVTFSVEYSTYEPLNYLPNFLEADFADVYSSVDTPMLEMQFTVKRNFSFASLGGEIAVGFYENESDSDLVNSTLTLYPIRLGAVLAFDALAPDPLFVPYVSGGGYVMIFREATPESSLNGNTAIAPYVHGGIALQLDWIDRQAARIAYNDSGIQNSYLFAEARMQMASTDEKDEDFSSDVSFAGGIRVEF